MMRDLVEKGRLKMGRAAVPSYSLIDSQSVKTTSASQERGIDGEKKIKDRKRHIVTDTQGHLLHVKVHAANTHDTVTGCGVFEEALGKYPTLQGVCADASSFARSNAAIFSVYAGQRAAKTQASRRKFRASRIL